MKKLIYDAFLEMIFNLTFGYPVSRTIKRGIQPKLSVAILLEEELNHYFNDCKCHF